MIPPTVDQVRKTLREIFVAPLTLTPDGRAYRFEGGAAIGRLLLGRVGLATFVARPAAERAVRGVARLIGRHPLLDQAGGLDLDVGADFAREVPVAAPLG
jgi:hypothetical protein